MKRKPPKPRPPEHEDWICEFDFCFRCGWPKRKRDRFLLRLETHEIARGPARAKALDEPCTWLRLCSDCHAESMSIAFQLALKFVHDPERYDRLTVNRLRGRADNAVSHKDMLFELMDILSARAMDY